MGVPCQGDLVVAEIACIAGVKVGVLVTEVSDRSNGDNNCRNN
jgi:hypothetical protein